MDVTIMSENNDEIHAQYKREIREGPGWLGGKARWLGWRLAGLGWLAGSDDHDHHDDHHQIKLREGPLAGLAAG